VASAATYRRGVASSERRVFFVERYVPGLDEAAAARLSSSLRAAVDELQREGRELEWLRSFALLEEETYVWMLAAGQVDDVLSVGERAGVSCDHMVEVVEGEPLASS
jgi:hypothetical protein